MKKKIKKSSNPLYDNYKKSWIFFKESKKYFLISTTIFLLFFIIGFYFPIFFRKEILDMIAEIFKSFEGAGIYETIWLILSNNVKASFLALMLGITAGIFPVLVAIFNGYILGFVSSYVVSNQGILTLWRLFPHGIFELPAVLISIGFGLKIGFELFKKNPAKTLKRNIKESIRFFVFVVIPLLVIAAVIEGLLVVYLG